jgi:hypothetical protein
VRAQESGLGENTAPTEAAEVSDPLREIFSVRRHAARLFPDLWEKVSDLPPFFRDTFLHFRARTYYFRQRDSDDGIANAWAGGGALVYKSGWLYDMFSVGAAAYTSQKILGKKTTDGTGLLRSRNRGYTVLGQGYGKLRYKGQELTAYRQRLDFPYVNAHDSRMSPNTFEAYMLEGDLTGFSKIGPVHYVGGYVSRMRRRSDSDFNSMAGSAGVPNDGTGMFASGLLLEPCSGCSFGAINYYVDDVIDIFYTSGSWKTDLNFGIGFRTDAQFSFQSSLNDDRVTGSEFDTWVFSGRFVGSYRSAVLSLAFAVVDDKETIQSPFGSYPGYISLMQSDFKTAGEESVGTVLAYTFDRWDIPELSMFTSYAWGSEGTDPATGTRGDYEQEVNYTIDYKIDKGLLRGVWFRLRGSWLDVEGTSQDTLQLRATINYDLTIL